MYIEITQDNEVKVSSSDSMGKCAHHIATFHILSITFGNIVEIVEELGYISQEAEYQVDRLWSIVNAILQTKYIGAK